MENIYLKDSVDAINTQIISAKKGNLIEAGQRNFYKLNMGKY